MNENTDRRRFLRDKKVDVLSDETASILDQLCALESEIDFVFDYIHEDTLERMEAGYETLSKIEMAINLLRLMTPQPAEIVDLLVSAANSIQDEQRRIRDGLTALLKALHPQA